MHISETPTNPSLAACADFLNRAAWPIIVVALVLFGFGLYASQTGLRYVTDRNDILETTAQYHQTYTAYKAEFGQEDDIVFVLEGPSPRANRAAARRLGLLLRQDKTHFKSVFDRLDLTFARRRVLYFLTLAELETLDRRLKAALPLLSRLLTRPGLVPLFSDVNDEVQAFVQEQIARIMAGQTKRVLREMPSGPDIAGALPVMARLVDEMRDSLSPDFQYESPIEDLVSPRLRSIRAPSLMEEIYLELDEGRIVIVLGRPIIQLGAYDPTAVVSEVSRGIAARVQRETGVQVGVTGRPVIESDEMVTSARDTEMATILSLVGVCLLFLLTYRNVGRPFLAMVCLMLSIGWTMGFAAMAIGHLTLLTVTVLPMLVGLNIDFGIQVISRYEEERCAGLEPLDAMRATLGGTGLSIVTAGLTTASSFIAIVYCDFKGVKEIAVLAGGGLMLGLVAMIVVLPAMLLLGERRRLGGRADAMRAGRMALLARVERGLLGHPYGVVFLAILFTGLCVAEARRVSFDFNALKLQSIGVPSVELEQKLASGAGRSIMFAEVVASDLSEARQLEKQLLEKPTVARVESLVPLVPEDQEAKTALVRSIHRTVAELPPMGPLPASVDVASLGRSIQELSDVFLLVYPRARKMGQEEVASGLKDFVMSSDLFLERLVKVGLSAAEPALRALQSAFFGDFREKIRMLRGADEMKPMRVEDVPESLRKMLMSPSGRLVLHVFPAEDVWERAPMERFLRDVRAVDIDATGTPVMVYESTILLRDSYGRAALIAFGVIVLVVFAQFRRLLATMLALLPLLLGLVWMVGLLGLLGIDFNAANYMALSLILGISVANGIYIVRRYQEDGSPAIFSISTGRAVLLSNLTTIIGFGSLMISRHQGMYSLGLVMSLGITACMVVSLVMLPALLEILSLNRVRV